MSDEAQDLGIEVDAEALSARIGMNVIPISALRRWNLDQLRTAARRPQPPTWAPRYSAAIEEGVGRIERLLPELPVNSRAVALAMLSGDESLQSWVKEWLSPAAIGEVDAVCEETQATIRETLSWRIQKERLAHVDAIVAEVYSSPDERAGGFRAWLGGVSMHPVWGVPVLILVLFAAWLLVGKWAAGDVVDWVENGIFDTWVNPTVIRGMDAIAPFPHVHAVEEGVMLADYTLTATVAGGATIGRFFHDLIAGPFGIVTMALTYAIAIVLPVVITFFFFFGLLEDSGYLPRLAVMLNRIFRAMGLNGKAVLPMILGLGCDTMATLTTRILETRKERVIVTLLLALGVPCSAQLGVIIAMLGPLGLPAIGAWLVAIGGTIFLVGWLAGKLVKGDGGEFVLEVPPVRIPKISNIAIKVAARTEWYLKEAVPLFVVGTLILYLADLTKVLPKIQTFVAPVVVGMLRLPAEAANAFLIGFLRRDYGAAGLFMMQRDGGLTPLQTVVSLTVITLFIPCIANFFMIIKERGLKTATWMAVFIIVYAFGVGWAMTRVLPMLPLGLH